VNEHSGVRFEISQNLKSLGGNLDYLLGFASETDTEDLHESDASGHEFRNVPTGVHATAIFQGEAGLLGNGLLSCFSTVTIDANARGLMLENYPVRETIGSRGQIELSRR
jgi:hypothetical protein